MKKGILLSLGAILIFHALFSQPVRAGDNMIVSKVDDFEPGVVINVCHRLVKPGNPFLVKGAFNCEAKVEAVDAPFPGGGINGDQLMFLVRKATGDKKINEVRVRSLPVGQDAGDQSAGMMTVDEGADEFYNNYVGRDKQGRLVIFLDIEVKPE